MLQDPEGGPPETWELWPGRWVILIYYHFHCNLIDSSLPLAHRVWTLVTRCKVCTDKVIYSMQEVCQSICDSIYITFLPSLFLHSPLCDCGPNAQFNTGCVFLASQVPYLHQFIISQLNQDPFCYRNGDSKTSAKVKSLAAWGFYD